MMADLTGYGDRFAEGVPGFGIVLVLAGFFIVVAVYFLYRTQAHDYQNARARRLAQKRIDDELGYDGAVVTRDGLLFHAEVDGPDVVMTLDGHGRIAPQLAGIHADFDLVARWPDREQPIPLGRVTSPQELAPLQLLLGAARCQLAGGRLEGVAPDALTDLVALRDAYFAAGEALSALGPIDERLAARVLDPLTPEDDAAIALALLHAHWPDSPQLPSARAALAERGAPLARWAVARTAPPREAREALLELLTDRDLDGGIRRAAFDPLTSRVERAELRDLLDYAAEQAPFLLEAATRAVVRARLPLDVALAARILPRLSSALIRADLVGAVARGEASEATTRWLVERLDAPEATVVEAAADALGRIGTPAALPHLGRITADLPPEDPTREACARAALAIRSRHTVSAGGLALVDADGGQLALAAGDGTLAVAEEDAR